MAPKSTQPPHSMICVARALVLTGTLLVLASVVAPTILKTATTLHRTPKRNVMKEDYSNVEYDHDQENFKLSHSQQKDFHWCLFGDDSACTCPGFARGTGPAWEDAHLHNKESLVPNEFGVADYEMVFYGDGLVEGFNGMARHKPIADSAEIQAYYRDMFTKDNNNDKGASINSVALGIAGDSTANLLYRLKNGEMPLNLNTNIFWLMIGANDLRQGGCSEQATVLGILKSAIMLHDQHPQSVVVIQGILPQGYEKDECSLEEPKHSFLGGRDPVDKEFPFLWSSIQRINAQLQEFCAQHEYFVFFDASDLFIEQQPHSAPRIDRRLMPDCQHLSPVGYQVLGSAIYEEYARIVWDEDLENQIESRTDNLGSTFKRSVVHA